jgi:hypothetical protein
MVVVNQADDLLKFHFHRHEDRADHANVEEVEHQEVEDHHNSLPLVQWVLVASPDGGGGGDLSLAREHVNIGI